MKRTSRKPKRTSRLFGLAKNAKGRKFVVLSAEYMRPGTAKVVVDAGKHGGRDGELWITVYPDPLPMRVFAPGSNVQWLESDLSSSEVSKVRAAAKLVLASNGRFKRTSRNPGIDTKVYSVIDRMTGLERRHLSKEQAKLTMEAHKEACARYGWREDTKVFYRDGTDVTREFRSSPVRNAAKLVRFPEGVMTEAEWVERYAARVTEEATSPLSFFDRHKFNRMDYAEQKHYEASLAKKAAKHRYRAYRSDGSFYDIGKRTYDSAPARLKANGQKKRTSRNPRLTEAQRSRLPFSTFVFPRRRAFPLESEAAAYDAIRMLRLGRVKSAADFKAVADAIRKKYPAVWKQYGTALSWPKVKAAKALGSKHRAATVAAKKRGSKRTSRKVAANKRGSR